MVASKKASSAALVIVESPAKAKTIERFLGPGYVVEASVGHVRDLPSSDAKLPPEAREGTRHGIRIEKGFEPVYVVSPDKKSQIQKLKQHLKGAGELWLATDEDREGEAISWHLVEVLKPKVPMHRMVFHEITEDAIRDALSHPRDIDMHLVAAQEARRILDRLYGYEVSPVLWRKIRGAKSAGRVQSVALRLLAERELERMAFTSASYWDLAATFATELGKDGEGRRAADFEAGLVEVGGRRVATGRDFAPETGRLTSPDVVHLDEEAAYALQKRLVDRPARVLSVEEKPYVRSPSAPFTTSTLQQEAGRKLRYSARRTMSVAQGLYENGVITYMRTDSTSLSSEAIEGARSFIRDHYGPPYLPASPRTYKTKVKNAQEAHEAIRPAGRSFLAIGEVRKRHGEEAARLYELIWMRTVASQMPDARGRNVTVRVGIDDAVFRVQGRTIEFPGYQRAYVEGSDDPIGELAERDTVLPALAEGQALHTSSLQPNGHATQPPQRYTEASLVKELDRRGIGRPSTWASIIGVLLDRGYAFRKSGSLVPSFMGIAVVQMLVRSFGELVDYEFTARMEDDLDSVSRGEQDGPSYLHRFWYGNGAPGLLRLVESGFDQVDARAAGTIPIGEEDGRRFEVRIGRYGLFMTDGTSNAPLPDDAVPDEIDVQAARILIDRAAQGPTPIGTDPESKKPVYVRVGRYGPYVQLGDATADGPKPKMQSLLPGMEPGAVTLEAALRLLSLPRELGPHPEDPEHRPVLAMTGRYGPFVKWGDESRSIPEGKNVLEITLPEAVEILKQPRRGRSQRAPTALRDLGAHPTSGAPLKVMSGRYGPYVTDGEVNASLPRNRDPNQLTTEEAVDLLQRRRERLAAGGGRPGRGRRAARATGGAPRGPKKKAARTPSAKKKTAAKKATKKKATRKKAARKKAAKEPTSSHGDRTTDRTRTSSE